jgi:hypothetical protein
MNRTAAELWEVFGRRTVAIAGALLALYGIAIAIAQIVAWLRTGQWSPVPVAMIFLRPPGVDPQLPIPYSLIPDWFFSERVASYLVEPQPGTWLGLRSIVIWLLKLSLSLVSFFGGVFTVGIQLTELSKGVAAW